MPLLLLAILALVQGLTELLPVSSSAHLILTWEVFQRLDTPTDLPAAQELMLDIAGHIGTLFAICLYFWRDLVGMAVGVAHAAQGRRDPKSRLALYILISAIPAAIVGLLFSDYIANHLRLVELIGWTQIGFGLLLYIADRTGLKLRKVEHLRVGDAVIVGLAQALALLPGTSRSGITMTAGRFLGLERAEAARFAFLISIPTIAGAGLLAIKDLYELGSVEMGLDAAITAALAFLSSLAVLAFMMRWVRRADFTVFVVYRVLLGCVLLYLVYSGTLTSLRF